MKSTSGRRRFASGMSVALLACWSAVSEAVQWLPLHSDANSQAIAYSTTAPADAVAVLQRAIDSGETELQYDDTHGYLRSVLRSLRVPISSQGLVFSATSFQRHLISAARPRALYFNSDVYVGWVPGGRVLEIASVDARLGVVFYTLEQRKTSRPQFERETRNCMACHDSPSATGGVPGLIVKSVHVDEGSRPVLLGREYITNDRSPMRERWGGWYVTGNNRPPAHMGIAPGPAVGTATYLSNESELASLTVLAHQADVQNLLTRLDYRTRMALHFDRQRNRDLGLDPGHVHDTTRRVVESIGEPLVRAMLFVDEAPPEALVSHGSSFTEFFSRQGPRDRRGRSLFELDLTRRLLRYPCSFLIYSPAFDALPDLAKDYVYRRLAAVLGGMETNPAFARLTPSDRQAVLEILRDTKPEFSRHAH